MSRTGDVEGHAAPPGPEAVTLLFERLATGDPGDPEVREAATAIAELHDPRSLGPLLEVLRRADGDAKCHYVHALEVLGDTRALPPLLGLMSYGLCETEIIGALGRIGDARALGPLVNALKDDRPAICAAAVEALGALGDPRTADALRACLDRPDADSAMREGVERALARIGQARD